MDYPRFRKTDPSSSAEGARSPHIAPQLRDVLLMLEMYDGKTTNELAKHFFADRYMLAKRMPELEAMGLVRAVSPSYCPKRPDRKVDPKQALCYVTKKKALRWYVSPRSLSSSPGSAATTGPGLFSEPESWPTGNRPDRGRLSAS